ncbi:S8 family serine peptidase [Gottfriedia sp. NPDC057948]|uniref:S8 family serine peptidase n=1 Tax=Gottfriedia sp. NPDC057948 TaxID=3346287 RepID=UPI0036D9A2EA
MSRRSFPYKVLATTTLATMLFSSTGFAEGTDENQVPAPSVDEIVKQGQKIFDEDQKQTAEDAVDPFGYKDLKNAQAYQQNDKVRVIVEVEEPTTTDTSSQTKRTRYRQKQDQVISQISKERSVPKINQRFYEGFNGFSMETEYRNLKDIEATPGVTNVHIARKFQPTMGASKELVQAQKVWQSYGYQGEGLLVAIVDTGIDYTHKDMTITEKGKSKEKWTKETIQSKLDQTSAPDVWYSDKVPTGYDWADHDTDVIPHSAGNSHGMHVAGTVGANGDESNDGVQGIAPGVQLLAEKVFSDKANGAYEDDIIAGIEHAVTMGADVINMSLGTDSGFVSEVDDPVQKAIREATEQGTLVVVAGGNSAYSTQNNLLQSSLKPYAENPDIGTVGEPGVSPYAISVASYENTSIHMSTLQEENGMQLPYQDQTQYNFNLSKVLSPLESYQMVYVGEGRTADFKNLPDLTGKIVVAKPNVKYGTYTYIQTEAKKKNAKAILLVPANEDIDYPRVYWSNLSTFPQAATTSKANGDALISKLKSGYIVKMKPSKGVYVDNPNKNKMSYFSSYGAPHTLDFKPELSAPGGNIYSTVPNNGYEVMSGTSMATPHVAGGSALVLQSLYEKGLQHSEDTALKAKIALMNTAKLVQDPRTNNEVPYSPRVQGSGLMQIQNAIKTPVVVTRKDTPLEQAGAVALKEIKTDNIHFKLNAEALQNLNVKDLEYQVYVDVFTDGRETKEFDLDNDGKLDSKEYLTLKSERIQGATATVNGETVTSTEGKTLKIKPGQEKNLDVQIQLPSSLKDGSFVEGYVRLVPSGNNSDSAVPLSVPYMGYYGEWDQPQNIDPAAFDKDAFLGYTTLWNDEIGAEGVFPLGYDPYTGRFNMDRIVMSPNTPLKEVYPSFTVLRNLEKAEMYVEDQKGNLIQYLGDFSEYTGSGQPWKFRKNIMSYRDYLYTGYGWDLKDQNGQLVNDGVYNYVIKTVLDYKDAKPQIVKLPFHIDSVAPVVSDIKVTPKDGQYEISFNATDSGSGYNGAIIWYNGKYKSLPQGAKSTLVNEEPKGVVVLGADYAHNHSYTVWGDPSYITVGMLVSNFNVYPYKNVNAKTPAGISGFASNDVNWKIYVKDANGQVVDSFDVANKNEIHLKWTPEVDVPNGAYTIYADVTSRDGFKVTTKPQTVTVQQ